MDTKVAVIAGAVGSILWTGCGIGHLAAWSRYAPELAHDLPLYRAYHSANLGQPLPDREIFRGAGEQAQDTSGVHVVRRSSRWEHATGATETAVFV